MSLLFRICVIALTFTFHSSVQGASAQGAYDALCKPDNTATIEWLGILEKQRDATHDPKVFLKISYEISATLAGKYGLRETPATPEERRQMIASIVRTRNDCPLMPTILSEMYFKHDPNGCWKRINNDHIYAAHIGAVFVVDAIARFIVSAGPIPELRAESPSQPSIPSTAFVKSIIGTAIEHSVYGDIKETVHKTTSQKPYLRFP